MKIKLKRFLTGLVPITMMAIVSTAAHPEEETSAVTQLWNSLAKSALDQTVQMGTGWALSAIGLAGGGSNSNQLAAISSELKTIEIELANISSQLTDIKNAIDFQTCAELENALAPGVTYIQDLYDQYHDQFIENPSIGGIVVPEDIEQWVEDVTNSTTGVPFYLEKINSALTNGVQNSVLSACIGALTEQYISDTGTTTGPSVNPFNDLVYYSAIQNLVNYYYGVQTQGATLLVEAYHLKACQAAESSDCDFSTISTGTSPTQPYDICTNAVQGTLPFTYCLDAEHAVTNPNSGDTSVYPAGDGLYERVTNQLVMAGAPYSWNGKLGIVWGYTDPIVMATSLEDFTNTATFENGAKITPNGCPTPLNSDTPCGYTKGLYNGEFDTGISYVLYGGVSDLALWNNIPSSELNTNKLWSLLFDPYNNYVKNGVVPPHNQPDDIIYYTGSVADYMNSIGFKNAEDKIIIFHDDAHKAWGSSAVCNIFTSLTKNMPYCNKTDHSAHVCSATANVSACEGTGGAGAHTHESNDIKNVISAKSYANGYYYLDYACSTLSCGWNTKPGWLKSQATKDKFFQYRWPMFNIKDLVKGQYDYCTVRKGTTAAPGYLNLGGQYTMCGNDLEAYINQLIPPPGTNVSQTLNTSSFQTGHTMSVSVSVSNYGLSRQADIFMGFIHPDGNTITFVISLDPLKLESGFWDKPGDFRSLFENQSIGEDLPNAYQHVFRYIFSGNESSGTYEMFTMLAKPGAFIDGSIDEGDIIAMDSDFFDFCDGAIDCNTEAAGIPTLHEWGLMIIAGLLGMIGLCAVGLRKVAG